MGERLGTPDAAGMGSNFNTGFRQVDSVQTGFHQCSGCLVQVTISGRGCPGSATNTTDDKETLTPVPEVFIRKKIIVAQRIEDFYWRLSTHCVGNIRKGTKAKQIFTLAGQLIVMTFLSSDYFTGDSL